MIGLMIPTYATIHSLDDLPEFYSDLFAGHAPEQYVEKAKHNYWELGMADLMTMYTRAIGEALAARLSSQLNEPIKLYIGGKHTRPYFEEVVEEAIVDGCNSLILLHLSPLHSKTGGYLYEYKLKKIVEAATRPIQVHSISKYAKDEAFQLLLAKRLQVSYAFIPQNFNSNVRIIFTSHSLPGTEQSNRDFIAQYYELGDRVMERGNLDLPYRYAYRSGGPETQKWLRPDILKVIEEEAENGATAVIVYELLSLIENQEVREELGRDAKELAHRLGLYYIQPTYLNDSYAFVQILERHIIESLT